MNNVYTFPKQTTKKTPEKMVVFFQNGDFFAVLGSEIVKTSLDYYDDLVRHNDSAVRVCHGGEIVLKIERGGRRRPRFLHDEKDYLACGADYLCRRLCEGGIDRIVIFNENNWHHTVLGDFIAERGDGEGVITLAPRHNDIYGDFSDDEFKIALPNVTKGTVEKITLDFENCDGFDVYAEEIVDMNLVFDKRLKWNSQGYGRRIIGGYMLIKLDRDITYRRASVYPDWSPKKGVKPLIKRLCYGGECSETDVCNLYVTYEYLGYGERLREEISLDGIGERNSGIYDFEVGADDYYACDYDDDDRDDDDDDEFVSGYARLNRDKTVLLVFGKAIPEGED